MLRNTFKLICAVAWRTEWRLIYRIMNKLEEDIKRYKIIKDMPKYQKFMRKYQESSIK